MTNSLKAEFRKILTVRSTYGILAFCIALLALFAGYIQGYRMSIGGSDPGYLANVFASSADFIAFPVALIGILLMTHEYRYSTIMYTLLAARSRWSVLLSKILTVSVVSILLALVLGGLATLFAYMGLTLGDGALVSQNWPTFDQLWRYVFYVWAFSMIALLIAALIRSQIAAIVFILFVPGTVEALLSLVLRENVRYLPFTALSGVTGQTSLSHGESALVVLAYLVVGWTIAFLLFMRRDAN